MNKAAQYLTGTHDFKAFCSNPKMKKSTVRYVDSIEIPEGLDRRLAGPTAPAQGLCLMKVDY